MRSDRGLDRDPGPGGHSDSKRISVRFPEIGSCLTVFCADSRSHCQMDQRHQEHADGGEPDDRPDTGQEHRSASDRQPDPEREHKGAGSSQGKMETCVHRRAQARIDPIRQAEHCQGCSPEQVEVCMDGSELEIVDHAHPNAQAHTC